MNDDNIPVPSPEPPEITIKVPAHRGTPPGEVGKAGIGQPGPNYVIVRTPRWKMALEELGYFFLKSWLGLTSTEALLAVVQSTTGAGEAWTSLTALLTRVTIMALGGTLFALGWRLLTWWSENRRTRGLPV